MSARRVMLLASSHESRASTHSARHSATARALFIQQPARLASHQCNHADRCTACGIAIYTLWFVYAHDQARPTYRERHVSKKSYEPTIRCRALCCSPTLGHRSSHDRATNGRGRTPTRNAIHQNRKPQLSVECPFCSQFASPAPEFVR
jgi:hypothetical protein